MLILIGWIFTSAFFCIEVCNAVHTESFAFFATEIKTRDGKDQEIVQDFGQIEVPCTDWDV